MVPLAYYKFTPRISLSSLAGDSAGGDNSTGAVTTAAAAVEEAVPTTTTTISCTAGLMLCLLHDIASRHVAGPCFVFRAWTQQTRLSASLWPVALVFLTDVLLRLLLLPLL